MKTNRVWLGVFGVVVGAFFLLVPPIPQDESYHLFADRRAVFGVPSFWNVVSNAPFIVIGLLGLLRLRSLLDRVLFAGVLLTGIGSAYYHLAPSDARLVWDRLPMTVVFMAFSTCVLSETGKIRHPVKLLFVLLAIGAGSVIWWRATNDLRPYGIVKFGPVLLLLSSLWSARKRAYLWVVFGLFGLAQAAELVDQAIYVIFPVSGHTVKHLLAALATYSMFLWRRPEVPQPADRQFQTVGSH
jgi:hypothetical protein